MGIYFVGRIITIIMIAKITLVSMLAAVAVAAPEPQLPLGYGLGYAGAAVTASKPTECVPSTEEIEIQSCAPSAAPVCKTEDVVSEEITYEKRCKEVVNKQCAQLGAHPVYKRAAEAEAEADPEAFYGLAGVAPYAHAVGVAHAAPLVAAPAPVAYAVPQAVTKSIETPCTEV